MRITEIRDLTVKLQGNISNAVVSFNDHTVSLVAVVSDQIRGGKPVIGFGFNSIGRYGQSGILRERMIPRIMDAAPASLNDPDRKRLSPAAIAAVAMKNEKPGGHGDRAGASGALELAIWDLNAKLDDSPAWQTIATAFDTDVRSPTTRVYAAGGYYYPDGGLADLRAEFESYCQRGFTAFKMKVGGASLAEDQKRIDIALEVAGSGNNLSIDANGRFDLATALRYARAVEHLELRWLEEPGDPLDYQLNRELIASYAGPVATGENLFSLQDLNNLINFAGMRVGQDIFQMDAGLSYGLTEYEAMIRLLESKGFDRTQCYPHGGHLINLHIAIGLGLGGCEAYPGVFEPFGGYAPECFLADGQVSATDAPGFGLEQKTQLAPYLSALSENVSTRF